MKVNAYARPDGGLSLNSDQDIIRSTAKHIRLLESMEAAVVDGLNPRYYRLLYAEDVMNALILLRHRLEVHLQQSSPIAISDAKVDVTDSTRSLLMETGAALLLIASTREFGPGHTFESVDDLRKFAEKEVKKVRLTLGIEKTQNIETNPEGESDDKSAVPIRIRRHLQRSRVRSQRLPHLVPRHRRIRT